MKKDRIKLLIQEQIKLENKANEYHKKAQNLRINIQHILNISGNEYYQMINSNNY